jgi:hypothetical protein
MIYMKKFRILIVCFVLLCCNSEEYVTEVVLGESIIPENAANTSIRPTFGFDGVYGGINTSYKIFCDTITPPQTEVAGAFDNPFNIMCYESVLLQPGKKYYWFCKALKEGNEYDTEINTFNTVDTSILNGNHWHYQFVLSESDYENQSAQEYSSYDLESDSCFLYGEPYGFTIIDDSVKNVYRSGNSQNILPTSGSYSFDIQNMNVLGWSYQFINLGTNYYHSNDNNANKIVLVLKQPYSGNIVIFTLSN